MEQEKITSLAIMIRQLEDDIMKYEKRVLEGFELQEEQFTTKLYNLLEKRNDQDAKIAEIKLVNENITAKLQENLDRLEK